MFLNTENKDIKLKMKHDLSGNIDFFYFHV